MVAEYTLDELVDLAEQASTPIKRRTVTNWIEVGLLAAPERRRGTGYGSEPSVVPERQRQLFETLLVQRQRGAERPLLANIPVYLWMYWGDSYVPLTQTRRAFTTWFRAVYNPSWADADDLASRHLDALVHPDASATDTNKMHRLLATSIYDGRIDDPGDFVKTFRRVFDPHRSGRTFGPPGVEATAQTWLRSLVWRMHLVTRLAEHTTGHDCTSDIPDTAFEHARRSANDSIAEYRMLRFTAKALWTSSDAPWQGADDQTLIENACADLLLHLANTPKDVP